MSSRRRIASALIASATVLGSVLAVDAVPLASAEPCQGPNAAGDPPAGAAGQPIPEPDEATLPVGRRPAGAKENAPLPNLGKLPLALVKAFAPLAKGAQRQGESMALPEPPGPGNPQPVRPVQPNTPAQHPAPAPQAAAPSPNTGGPAGTSIVGWVTGPETNSLQRFGISGTDLGIMWDNGNHQVLMAFGDTYGFCAVKGSQWRYNTLMRTQDRSLSGNVAVDNSPTWSSGLAKQIITPPKWATRECGIIPTAGISVAGVQYINFMSIKSWDANGAWTTNYSGIAASRDNGQNWSVLPASVRTPTAESVPAATFAPGNENFQQGAFFKPGPGDPYLYSFGTPSGRGGSAFISRIRGGAVGDPRAYDYWSNESNSWVPNNPAAASAVIPGPVGEMSAQYNRYLNQYLALYTDGGNNVVARTAPAPQGPWGPPQTLVTSMEVPGGIYGPFLHPWSNGREIYYSLSLWSAYNVMMMKTTLP